MTILMKNVNKYFKEQTAVSDFNLKIEDNELIVLVGPSGCGKSTTLRLIAGLVDLSEGEIYIDGFLVNDLAPRQRNIAMVFQSYALYPHKTVYENLAFGLKMHKEDKKTIHEKVMAVAEMLDIENYLNRKPSKLSGGEKQRVAIGRALVREPKVFLMDEPLSNLDAKLRNTMRAEILKLHKKLNATIVYVTHDQLEAMTLGDRIVVMNKGVIQQCDTPENIFNKPKNKFVAEFIGMPPMNFLDAKLICLDGKCYAELTDIKQKLLLDKNISCCKDDYKVNIGIRPEHIQIVHELADCNSLTTNIDIAEKMGSEMHLHLSLGNNNLIVKTNTLSSIEQDMILNIYLPPDHLYVFDGENGENIGL